MVDSHMMRRVMVGYRGTRGQACRVVATRFDAFPWGLELFPVGLASSMLFYPARSWLFLLFYGDGSKVSPAAAIEPLPEQLDRRLCAIEFFGGHVDVVHEKDKFLARGGTEHALPTLLTLAVDQVLQTEKNKSDKTVHTQDRSRSISYRSYR